MKKALFVATVASHIRAFHLPYLKLLKDNGYKVYVAANWNLNKNEKLPNCDEFIQIPIQRSPYSLKNITAIKELKRVIEKEKFDIIHCHTPMGSVVARLASIKARKNYGTRVIYTAHGFHFYKGAPKKNWLMFYPVEWYLAKYTDCLITINGEDYDIAKKKFTKRCHSVLYVPGVGIDPQKFNINISNLEKQKLRESLGLKKDDFVFLYPAELSSRKRQLWLINSLSTVLQKHANIHILLAGKDSLKGECQKLVNKRNLQSNIHFLGYRNDIPKLLEIADAAISSARQEGLPVNIMEAMYKELPIVASNCRGNRDLVMNNKNGYLIDINDYNKYAECVEKIYLDKEKNKEFGIQSKKLIERYLLDNIVEEMKKIYKI
ncbi:MAG: glycosyltransferase family 4 protein [Bacilli bacterium]|nr:glycosyltransferase family 4 protein [Bacilli bacterium]